MSHSSVGVIMPKHATLQEVEDRLADLMAPFDENTDVPEYDRPCGCIGWIAFKDARAAADQAVGTIDSLRESFNAAHPNLPPFDEEGNHLWRQHIAPYEAAEAAALAVHPLKDSPDQDCDECHGSGTYRSTYNPKSRWDYYEIGGSWYGDLKDNVPNYNSWRTKPRGAAAVPDNTIPIRDLKEGQRFFALLTPDGEWHERGKMGWFGMVHEEKATKDWQAQQAEVLSAYPDHLIVLVDVHI